MMFTTPDNNSYTFTIEGSPVEVEKFYENEMAKIGWDMYAKGEGNPNGTLLLLFKKGNDTMSIGVFPQPDGLLFVMILKV